VTNAKQVAAIIVHHGDLQRTVRAVLSHWKLGVFSQIIVVANDLRPRPAELGDNHCVWLIPARNVGFGSACQLGATTFQADVYAFFNAHITIDRASTDRCIAAFTTEDVGIVSPYIYYPRSANAAVNWEYTHCTRTYSRFLRLPIQVPCNNDQVDAKIVDKLLDNDWATGGAVFCRREIIRDVGWVGSYFLSFEDVDISIRAKNSGWRVVVAASAIAFHTGESTRTSTITAYYAMRNLVWLTRKHHVRRVQALLTLYLLLRLCRIAIADMSKRRRPPHARPAMRGILDGWLLWPDSNEALPGEPLWSGER